jgi:YegS/Rv2252/BmrU family lipid kinase
VSEQATSPIITGKTVAIVNPRASSGAAKHRWETVAEAVGIRMPGLETQFTEGPNHATQLCRTALEAGAETILAVGGDGTTNEVLNGFVDERGRNRFPRAVLAMLAAGTGGDFQRMFGRVNIQRQVDRMSAATPRTVDYGVVHFVDANGRPQTRAYLNIASVGVSGEVSRQVNESNAQLSATLKYLIGTFKGMRVWKNVQVVIALDDELDTPGTGRRVDLTLGIVGNGQYFGAGMWVCPNAKIDDGLFDCIEVTGMSRTRLTAALAKVFRGKHLRTSGIAHRLAKRVAYSPVSSDADVPIEIDGEQVGRLPARFELMPAALRIRIA